jgi:hypothetical protein
MRSQMGEIANDRLNQILLAIPEIREEFALFFGGQKVGRKCRQRHVDGFRGGTRRAEVTFLPLGIRWHPTFPQKTE